jgi:hypothetical protein
LASEWFEVGEKAVEPLQKWGNSVRKGLPIKMEGFLEVCTQVAARLLFQHLAKSARTVTRDVFFLDPFNLGTKEVHRRRDAPQCVPPDVRPLSNGRLIQTG